MRKLVTLLFFIGMLSGCSHTRSINVRLDLSDVQITSEQLRILRAEQYTHGMIGITLYRTAGEPIPLDANGEVLLTELHEADRFRVILTKHGVVLADCRYREDEGILLDYMTPGERKVLPVQKGSDGVAFVVIRLEADRLPSLDH